MKSLSVATDPVATKHQLRDAFRGIITDSNIDTMPTFVSLGGPFVGSPDGEPITVKTVRDRKYDVLEVRNPQTLNLVCAIYFEQHPSGVIKAVVR